MKGFFKFFAKTFLISFLFFLPSFAFSDTKHTVEKGDTLFSISRRYGISVDELCSKNSLTRESLIKVGQVLNIPEKKENISSATKDSKTAGSVKTEKSDEKSSKKTLSSSDSSDVKKTEDKSASRKYDIYTVQKGDTLYGISKKNGISVAELKELNQLADNSSLKIGQTLKVPKSEIQLDNKVPDLPLNDPRTYSSKSGDSSLVWPVKKPAVTYMKGKVGGVQLSAQKNENVTCIRSGTVMYVGNYRGYGQVVMVQSKTGHIYAYTGLGAIKVKKGAYVVFGDTLGTAGTDSIKGTSQISLMVFQKSNPVDPAKAPRG